MVACVFLYLLYTDCLSKVKLYSGNRQQLPEHVVVLEG